MVRLIAPFIFHFWKTPKSCNLGSYRKVHLQTLHASEMLLLFRELINKYDFDPNLKKVYLCQDMNIWNWRKESNFHALVVWGKVKKSHSGQKNKSQSKYLPQFTEEKHVALWNKKHSLQTVTLKSTGSMGFFWKQVILL